MAEAMLTAARLRELLHYDPDTGVFTWRAKPRKDLPAGALAGSIKADSGYRTIFVQKRNYPAHRLAWLYVNGEWPKQDIDHINGDRADNRIVNLRDVSRSVNLQNRRKRVVDTASGLLGVTASRGRWGAKIQTNGKTTHLGTYDTREEAHQAYLAAKRRLHVGCTI